jgi:hypothetical protein
MAESSRRRRIAAVYCSGVWTDVIDLDVVDTGPVHRLLPQSFRPSRLCAAIDSSSAA